MPPFHTHSTTTYSPPSTIYEPGAKNRTPEQVKAAQHRSQKPRRRRTRTGTKTTLYTKNSSTKAPMSNANAKKNATPGEYHLPCLPSLKARSKNRPQRNSLTSKERGGGRMHKIIYLLFIDESIVLYLYTRNIQRSNEIPRYYKPVPPHQASEDIVVHNSINRKRNYDPTTQRDTLLASTPLVRFKPHRPFESPTRHKEIRSSIDRR